MAPDQPVVVDTSVVVAGLITSDHGAPTRRILDRMLRAELRFAVSQALLADYRNVLLRPAVQERHGLAESQIDEVLTRLALEAIVAQPQAGNTPQAQDPGNQVIWDLLHELDQPTFISGDLIVLLASTKLWTSYSPSDFLRQTGGDETATGAAEACNPVPKPGNSVVP